MTSIHIDVQREDVDFLLAKVSEVLSGPSLSYFLETRVDPQFRDRMESRFANEGDEFGKWAPLRPATQDIREAEGFPRSHPINVRTGDLRQWMLAEGIIHASASDAQIDFPGRPTGGADLALKLKTAQHGRKEPRTRPRPVLAWHEKDTVETVRQLAEWFVIAISR